MGEIIAACGHRLKRKEILTVEPVNVAVVGRDGIHRVSYILYCPRCVEIARRAGTLLETEEAQRAWLEGEGDSQNI